MTNLTFFRQYSRPSVTKFIAAVVLCVLLCGTLCSCAAQPQGTTTPDESAQTTAAETATAAPVMKVSVIVSEKSEDYENAYTGFLRALSDNGYEQNVNLSFTRYDCSGSDSKCKSAAKKAKSADCDIVYVIGEAAAKAAKKAVTDIPVVFSCVFDPIESGILKSCESPEGNVTGVSDFIPVYEQIDLVMSLCPKTKKIGCIFNEADEQSVMVAKLASAEAKLSGTNLKEYPCSDENDFNDKLSKLADECDAVYLPEDGLTKALIKNVVSKAKSNKLPVIAENLDMVKAGALATCLIDYDKLGHRAGDIALLIYRGVNKVSEISVEYPGDCAVNINRKRLDALGIKLSDDVSAGAVFV